MSIRSRIASFIDPERDERRAPLPSFSMSEGTINMETGLGSITMYGDGPTDQDVQQAMGVSAFHACVRVIAESLGQLPVRLMRKEGEASVKADDLSLYNVLNKRPNGYQSQFDFISQLATNCCVWGNAFAIKEYDNTGDVIALWPIHPACVSVELLKNNSLAYDYMPGPGLEPVRYSQDQIVHVRYLSDSGYMGMTPVTIMRNVVQAARNIDIYNAYFWKNEAKPSVVLTTANPIPQEAADKMRRQWETMFRGPLNSGKTAVLPNGVSLQPVVAATNEASQMVQLRTMITQQIARSMRVPNHLIGEDSRSTYSNAEQAALNWVTGGLAAWICRFESAFNIGLLESKPDCFVQIDVRAMLRGDSATRASVYQQLFQVGALSPAEIRDLEDFPPVDQPGMNEHYVPINNYATTAEAAKEKDMIDETNEEQP